MPLRTSALPNPGSLSNSLKNVHEVARSQARMAWLKSSADSSFENYDIDRSISPKSSLYLNSTSPSPSSRSDSYEISDGVEAEVFNQKRLRQPVAQDSIRTNLTSQSSGFGTMSESSSNCSLNVSLSSSSCGEIYKGEWIADKRNVYGVSEYIDESRYFGSWKDNARQGYGMLSQSSETRSGKWQNDELASPIKRGISIRSPRMRGKVRAAVDGATEAAEIAMEKGRTALTRGVTARKIATLAKVAGAKAEKCAVIARAREAEFDVALSETGWFSFFVLFYLILKIFIRFDCQF